MRNIPQLILLPIAAVAPAAIVVNAYAEDYLTAAQAQRVLFPLAQHFVETSLSLTPAQMEQIKEMSGVRQRQASVQIWRAESNGNFLGWFIVDEVIGKHEFITYATAISPEGKVIGVDILSYRETHGGQVRTPEWRKNFAGKTVQDAFKLGQDIPNISGATLSCRNLTDGVKRLLIIQKLLLKP